jgi:hypothetical protein
MLPAAKGAATLTLRLRADEKAASGAFRILGKAQGGATRTARVVTKEPEESVEWLWVGVAGK